MGRSIWAAHCVEQQLAPPLYSSRYVNFEFAKLLNSYLLRGEIAQAIELAENQLAAIPLSPFHQIAGRSLLDQTHTLCHWADEFHRSVDVNQPVKALYFELTEFDVNTDEWAIDGFAYTADYGLATAEDWLPDYCAASENALILEGYESLQEAFEELEIESDDLQNARDWCEQLIIARYMQLLQAARTEAKRQGLAWAALPAYCTEHGYDFIASI
ncbi:hypothetical protein [Hymenobacter psychrophilus]|uniref:Uncharacterized protein n=1 Tax=Hymenobacter psychrophilus TaxID=651662 RepID=A0A1H3B774_9BACT|nr:hypothetical protein [Hymenobacter psychrophilus]SDX37807.1 hypothetical protein SAMN04488069_101184 [Hymenobacter psychrophilus]